METLVFVAGIVVVTAVVIGLTMHSAKKRREAWQAVALKLEMAYERDAPLADYYPGFKSFSLGRSRVADNLLVGSSGSVSVKLGDYRYTTGSGKNSSTHYFTICILEKEGLGLPRSYMRPQNFFDAIGKIFGGQDIDFAEDPEFSKTFVLQGEDEGAIRSKFDRPARSWLVAHKERFRLFEAKGSTIAFFAPRMEPDQAPKLLDEALDFLMIWG